MEYCFFGHLQSIKIYMHSNYCKLSNIQSHTHRKIDIDIESKFDQIHTYIGRKVDQTHMHLVVKNLQMHAS
jgi:hypothetical protein